LSCSILDQKLRNCLAPVGRRRAIPALKAITTT
jgi:hypothetical protein